VAQTFGFTAGVTYSYAVEVLAMTALARLAECYLLAVFCVFSLRSLDKDCNVTMWCWVEMTEFCLISIPSQSLLLVLTLYVATYAYIVSQRNGANFARSNAPSCTDEYR